jgi:hypothetical protein
MTDAANRDDLDDEAYKEFLASHSESEASDGGDDDEDMDTDKIEEYRRKLLGGLSSAKVGDKRDLQYGGGGDDSDDDGDKLDVKFNVGFGEDIGKKVIADKKLKKQAEGETAWDSYQRKRKEKKKDKKDKAKKNKQEVKKQGTANPEETHRQTAELELLIGDKNNGNITGTFKADTKDKRF